MEGLRRAHVIDVYVVQVVLHVDVCHAIPPLRYIWHVLILVKHLGEGQHKAPCV